MKHLTLLLCLAIAQCGLSPAWADTVELPDAPPPAVEPGGPDASDLAASAPIGGDLAMLYTVPTATDGIPSIQPTPAASPLRVRASSGGETRLSVDVGAANAMAEREGWATWQKWTVIGVAVVATAVAGVLIVNATQHHGNTSGDNSSTTVHVPGNGNTVNIGSPIYGPAVPRTPTTNGGDE